MSANDLRERVINFVKNIPSEANPYLVTAKFLSDQLQSPPLPRWSRWVARLTLLGFIIMFFQACYLLYVRINTKQFRFFTWNSLGLLQLDVSGVGAMSYIAYSTVAIIDLAFKETIRRGQHDQTGQLFLNGVKFIIILEWLWVFLWVRACQLAALTKGNLARASRCIINISLVLMSLWPIPPIFWAYVKLNLEYIHVKDTIKPIMAELSLAAPSYTTKTYNQAHIWIISMPALRVVPHIQLACHYARIGLKSYLVFLSLVCSLYMPLVVFELRRFYQQSQLEAEIEVTPFSSHGGNLILGHPSQIARETRKMARDHTLTACVGTAVHIPILIWLLSFPDTAFFRSQSWETVAYLGLHGPFSIIGNLSLLILNVHARKVFHYKKDQFIPSTNHVGKPDPEHRVPLLSRLVSRVRQSNVTGQNAVEIRETGECVRKIAPPSCVDTDQSIKPSTSSLGFVIKQDNLPWKLDTPALSEAMALDVGDQVLFDGTVRSDLVLGDDSMVTSTTKLTFFESK